MSNNTIYQPHYDVAPQIHIPSGAGHEQIRVVELILRESNTYNEQLYRPYQTQQVTPDAMDGFQSAYGDAYQVTPSGVARFANSLIAPSAVDRGAVPIVQGWQERRFIFLMEILVSRHAGVQETVILTGYTDYLGASRSGALDPGMRLYFTNAIKLQRVQDNMGTGLQYSNRILEATQVIYENPWAQKTFNNSPSIITMRPNDIFGKMQSNFYAGDVSTCSDWRNGSSINVEPVKFSKATNSSSSHYISRIVSNLKTALNSDDQWADQLAKAQTYAPEMKCRTDYVFKAFRNSTDFDIGKSVTVGDLLDLSPSMDSVTSVIFNGNALDIMSGGNTQHWGGSNYETIFASSLAHSVPAIMMECAIRAISFIAHNNTIDGSWVVEWTGVPQGFSKNLNLTEYLARWHNRMITEVLNALLPDYYVPVYMNITCDLVRDTVMTISYNDGPEIPYLNPAFGNGLTSPILTNDQHDLDLITADMETLCTAVGLNEDIDHRGNYHGFNSFV